MTRMQKCTYCGANIKDGICEADCGWDRPFRRKQKRGKK